MQTNLIKAQINVRSIKDNDILFGRKDEDACFVYRVKKDGSLEFSHISDRSIESFLLFADSMFVDVMKSCILWINRKKRVRASNVVDYLVKHNPLSVNMDSSQTIYRCFMTRFIAQAAYCSKKDYENGGISYYLIKLQHGDSYLEYYPFQLKIPHVLLPYCSISARRLEEYCDAEGLRYVKFKLIVRYKDRTAPTELGKKIIGILPSLSSEYDSKYKRIIRISLRLYDRYLKQNKSIGNVVDRSIRM